MRVAMVCPYDLAQPGGVQGQVIGLSQVLRSLGHDVQVIAPGDLPERVRGTSAGRAFRVPVNGSLAPMALHPSAIVRTVRALRAAQVDVVHLHEPFAPSITLPALLADAAPVVATFHAAGEQTPYRWFGSSLRRVASRIDTRVAVSRSAARLATDHLGGSYAVLGNGIQLERFAGGPHRSRRSDAILFLGRHEPRKGLQVLLNAVEEMGAAVPVWIAGEGPETARLRRRHRDARVEWLGQLSEAEKLRRLRDAAVLCAPSLHGESFGMVLLEAMCAGTAVVASDIDGYREVSDGGRAACLVAPGDTARLAHSLQRMVTDAAHRLHMQSLGYQQARRYSMDELARRYVAVYEHVVEDAVPRRIRSAPKRGQVARPAWRTVRGNRPRLRP